MTPYSIRAIIMAICLTFSFNIRAAWNLTQTTVYLNSGSGNASHAGVINADANPAIHGTYLGNFNAGGTLTLNGGLIRLNLTTTSNACNATVFYRLYRSCDAVPAWTAIPLTTVTNPSTGVRQYSLNNAGIDLLGSLTPATYFLEVRWQVAGHATCSNCCTQYLNHENGGSGYRAYFDYAMFDSFTDKNLNAAPAWSGETTNFRFTNSSTASTGASNSRTVRLKGPANTGGDYISTSNSIWGATEQHWSFWIGTRSQPLDNNNTVAIWLYANESNLESATVDGYRLIIGDNSGGDEFQLQSVTNGTGTTILTSSAITNGLTDIGIAVHVMRATGGVWTLYTSPLPTANGTGQTAHTCAESSSTVNHGSTTNTTHSLTGTGYFGIRCTHTNSITSRQNVEFDALALRAINPIQTQVQLAAASGSAFENGGTITLGLTITNPSTTTATVATLSRISGSASRVGGFTTQTVTFPANSSAIQNVTINLTDNSDCDDIASIAFAITGISGGNSAIIFSPNQYVLTLIDNDMEYPILRDDDLESGDLAEWTLASPGSWTASTNTPINGSYSLRHTASGSAGTTHAVTSIKEESMQGVSTTWRFNLSHAGIEPDHNDKFMVFLNANEMNLFGTTVDGYAVGINPANAAAPDIITLWRITDGNPVSAIVTSPVDWSSSLQEVGFEITRTDQGVWELLLDLDGNFDALVSAGTGTDTQYQELQYFGLRYLYKASTSGQLILDDISIGQKGCKSIWYSQTTGDFSGPIWAKATTGTSTIAPSSRYTGYVIQNGHQVNLNTDRLCSQLEIQTGAIFNFGMNNLRIYNDLNCSGTIIPAAGTITFEGSQAQAISQTGPLTFTNIVVNNKDQVISLSGAHDTRVSGTISFKRGTLHTSDKLVLSSDINGTGSIGEIVNGSDLTGQITIERYIPALSNYPYGSWVGLGNPLQNVTIASWNDDITTTGFAGSDFPPPYTFVNIQSYDESVAGATGNGYEAAASTSDVLSTDKGYMVYLESTAHNVDVTGDIQKGSFNKNLSYTNTGNVADGWNLVANAYPSQVDFNDMVQNGSGVSSYYLFDAEISNYRVYNGFISTGNAQRYINSSQAFFVKANMPGSYLRYEEHYKSNEAVSFERSDESNSYLSLTITSFNQTQDESILYFTSDATAAFEWNYDSEKLASQNADAVNMALLSSDNVMLSIDARPYATAQNTIPVFAEFPVAGTYILTVGEVNQLPPGSCMMIEDIISGETIDALSNETITIQITEPFEGTRFLIHCSPAANIAVANTTCFHADNGAITLDTPGTNWYCELFDGTNIQSAQGEFIQFNNLEAGNYQISMTPLEEGCQAASAEIIVQEPEAEILQVIDTNADACNNSQSGFAAFEITANENYQYTWTNLENGEIIEGNSVNPTLHFEQLTAGSYLLQVNTSCASMEQTVDISDPLAVQATIVAPTATYQINDEGIAQIQLQAITANATAVVWHMNGVMVSSDEQLLLEVGAPGQYDFTLTATNEQCENTDTHSVSVQPVNIEEHRVGIIDILQTPTSWQLQLNHEQSREGEIMVYGSTGKLIQQHTFNGNQVILDHQHLPAGLYFITIEFENGLGEMKQVVKL